MRKMMVKKEADNNLLSPLWVAAITALLTLLLAGGAAYYLGFLTPPGIQQEIQSTGGKGGEEHKIAYWRAPMNPTEIYDAPGKSAMGMDLVPVYEDELVGGVEIKVDPVTQQNMGVRIAIVEKAPLTQTIRTYGHITYDETRTAEVSPKISGWIEKIHVDFTGKFVKKMQPLFELYSPELFAAQQEYLVTYRNLNRMSKQANKGLLKAARQRLRYFDVAESEIRAMEKTGKIKKTVTIRSPFDGVVILKKAVEGSYVKDGATVYRIADLSRVWVEVHIYEFEFPWVAKGQAAEMTLPYLPGRTFSGRIAYVYPYLQRKTRDVIIRLEFDNPNFVLKPNMYADVKLKRRAGEGIVIPSEAVIRSGERNIVFVLRDQNKFTPRNVTLGFNLDNGNIQVIKGLAPGEKVVTSGQFLLDSESKLKEAVQKMMEAKREKAREKAPVEPGEEDFFKELETGEDFFKDMEEEEDFFEDIEEES